MFFEVSEIEATLDKVNKLGGITVKHQTSLGMGGAFALFTDSEGNMVGIYQPKA